MSMIFKNPTIKSDYEMNKRIQKMSKEEASRFWKKNNFTEERISFSIMIGYLSSVCEMADEYNDQTDEKVSLDLTYDTVANLPVILGYQYFAYVKSGSYTSEKTLEIVNKTLAAYFMLLCMNEHMCFPTVSKLHNYDAIMKSIAGDLDLTHNDSWMGYTVRVGVNKEYDLLQELGQVVKISASGLLRIRISRLVELYKQMCGVDLREKGLDDFEGKLKKQL
jgi:hypothetical protein